MERLLLVSSSVVHGTGYLDHCADELARLYRDAGVGREGFHELLDDKLDSMLGAHKVLVGGVEERVREASVAEGPWPERMRAALAGRLAVAAEVGAAGSGSRCSPGRAGRRKAPRRRHPKPAGAGSPKGENVAKAGVCATSDRHRRSGISRRRPPE